MQTKRRRAFLIVIALLMLCVPVLSFASCGKNNQAAGQEEGQSTGQQATGQQATGQSGQGGNDLADLRHALDGQVELYHGAELDASPEAALRLNESGEWILLTRDAQEKVVQFYDHELRKVKDLVKEGHGNGASYSFRIGGGKTVTLTIEPASQASPDGTRIIFIIAE